MAHVKKTYVAREGVNLNKFNKISETTSSVILQNAPDSISVAGTPFSAAWMNELETTAAQLSNLNVITDIDDIPALGTGVYTATGATGAPTADTIVYEYKGEATAGILTAKPVSANFGQVWERRRSGSAWVTGWMLKSGWGTMALDTEYLTDYDVSGNPVYKQVITLTAPSQQDATSKVIGDPITIIDSHVWASATSTPSGYQQYIPYITGDGSLYVSYSFNDGSGASDKFKIKNKSNNAAYCYIYAEYKKV
jgi:hypothetical protein